MISKLVALTENKESKPQINVFGDQEKENQFQIGSQEPKLQSKAQSNGFGKIIGGSQSNSIHPLPEEKKTDRKGSFIGNVFRSLWRRISGQKNVQGIQKRQISQCEQASFDVDTKLGCSLDPSLFEDNEQ